MVQPQALASAVGFDPSVPLRRANDYRRRENAHPGNATPIAYRTTRGADALRSMRWGLVPSFTRRGDKPDYFRMFNARSETASEKPSFRRLVGRRHGVVAFSGFYEWKKDERGEKQPYYFRFRDDRPMLFAVIYDIWWQGDPYGGTKTGRESIGGDTNTTKAPLKDVKPGEGDVEDTIKVFAQQEREEGQEATVLRELEEEEDGAESVMFSYAVLTTSAAPRLTWLHERMPVILRGAEDAERWLRVEGSEQASMFLKNHAPYNDSDLVWHPVSKQMNSMRYDGEDCSAPIELKPQKPLPAITTFFKKKPKLLKSSASSCGASDQKVETEGMEDGGGHKCVERELFDLTEDGVDVDGCGNGSGSPSVAGLSITGLSPPPGPPEEPSPSSTTPGLKRPRAEETRRNDIARAPKRTESNVGQWPTPSDTSHPKRTCGRGNGGSSGGKISPRKSGRSPAGRSKTHQPNLMSFFQPSA